jgi:cold shock CspA family protein/ribosome-associated translation inhibitor RaiA
MVIPLKIASRDRELSASEKSAIEELSGGLEDFYARIVSCEVHVDGPGGHHRQGTHRIRIILEVPSRTIVISRRKSGTFQTALGEAFRAAGRRLEDHARRVRGDVKVRAESLQGRVARLFPDEGYGFLESSGREIYFHRNCVRAPGFEKLAPGTAVRFTEEPGFNGPQASTISIIGSKPAARRV